MAALRESPARKAVTWCLLGVGIIANLLPVWIYYLHVKPEDKTGCVPRDIFANVTLICSIVGVLSLFPAVVLSKGIVKKVIGLALGTLDVFATPGLALLIWMREAFSNLY